MAQAGETASSPQLDCVERAVRQMGPLLGCDPSVISIEILYGKKLVFYAQGDTIHLSEDIAALPGRVARRIIAHELAHFCQKRNDPDGSAPSSEVELESEAHAAARFVEAGLPYRCSLADRPCIRRHWDQAGHFYTVYLCYLAAGPASGPGRVNPRHAAIAAWLPDAIAPAAAKTSAARRVGLDWSVLNPLADDLCDPSSIMHAIHCGLHALTGADVEVERKARRADLLSRSKSSPPWLKHVALHGFGDCYSHMDRTKSDATMCGPGWGHTDFDEEQSGASADWIWHPSRSKPYQDYVAALYAIACEHQGSKTDDNALSDMLYACNPMYDDKAKRVKHARCSPAAAALAERKPCRTEAACIAHLQLVAKDVLNKHESMSYGEGGMCYEKLSWEAFFGVQEHSKIFTNTDRMSPESFFYNDAKMFPNAQLFPDGEPDYRKLGILSLACKLTNLRKDKVSEKKVFYYPRKIRK